MKRFLILICLPLLGCATSSPRTQPPTPAYSLRTPLAAPVPMVAGPISPLMLNAVAPLLRTNVVLRWDYDAEHLVGTVFHVSSSTNLMTSLYDWEIVGEVSGITAIELPITADAQRFYTVTASNWWGRSDFSNVAGTPPIPVTPQGLAIE